ncbi:hypothetical protein OAN307_c02140 [Octadecabacter antarcticus 307]|uniref:Zinc finger/thioredoxin putative domain-containing protein n=1 Tax=Octadecabacter antarcticus 307 TaxID=391626 RepID=M9R6Q1_9RHOB|nr:zinc-ribbon domain-containing protein [Octadecabacter antarcticus]AGI65981.1 hypothetical protein OAN307_c02140 [Octadecabacter antarcticus 307]
MRLICPNCGAQYEVADDVIPTGGRDVQCSNCSHTWFEQPGASVAAELGTATETPPAPTAEPVPQPDPVAEPVPDPEPTRKAPEPREMDAEVADILRQEAEYEQAAREADTNTIETQPDLDLSHDPEEDYRSRQARERLARLRGEPETGAAAVGAALAQDTVAPRRELLPNIEEINSTLRPDANANATVNDDTDTAHPRGGFKRGFMYVVLVALIALAIYVFAPQISTAVPQFEPYLTSYVGWVDGLRILLDQQIQGLIEVPIEAAVEPNPEG